MSVKVRVFNRTTGQGASISARSPEDRGGAKVQVAVGDSISLESSDGVTISGVGPGSRDALPARGPGQPVSKLPPPPPPPPSASKPVPFDPRSATEEELELDYTYEWQELPVNPGKSDGAMATTINQNGQYIVASHEGVLVGDINRGPQPAALKLPDGTAVDSRRHRHQATALNNKGQFVVATENGYLVGNLSNGAEANYLTNKTGDRLRPKQRDVHYGADINEEGQFVVTCGDRAYLGDVDEGNQAWAVPGSGGTRLDAVGASGGTASISDDGRYIVASGGGILVGDIDEGVAATPLLENRRVKYDDPLREVKETEMDRRRIEGAVQRGEMPAGVRFTGPVDERLNRFVPDAVPVGGRGTLGRFAHKVSSLMDSATDSIGMTSFSEARGIFEARGVDFSDFNRI